MSKLFAARVISVLAFALVTCGCATTSPWGQQVSMPSGEHVWRAAKNAAQQKRTWVPLVGAATSLALDIDEDISDWAVEKTPIFGSNKSAANASDDLRLALFAGFLGTAVVADSGENGLQHKTKGLVTQFGGAGSALATTYVLKRAIGRERPNGASDLSMPSGHATHAVAYANWIDFNVEQYSINPTAKSVIQYSGYTAAGLTAWARIEAQKHYPSDVLVGTAIANFFSDFFQEAFFAESAADISWFVPEYGGMAMRLEFQF